MYFNESWLGQEVSLRDDVDNYCKLEGLDRFTVSENPGEGESDRKKNPWSVFQSIFHGEQ